MVVGQWRRECCQAKLKKQMKPEEIERGLAALGYPGFAHVRSSEECHPSETVLAALASPNLDVRLVEALPWVFLHYPDLNWLWIRDQAKLNNVQNRLGYVLHLAQQAAISHPESAHVVQVLSKWQKDLEEARLTQEGTLCRDSMPEREREWLRNYRPAAAAYWRLLTGLTAEQLPYVTP